MFERNRSKIVKLPAKDYDLASTSIVWFPHAYFGLVSWITLLLVNIILLSTENKK